MADVLVGTVIEFRRGRGRILLDSKETVPFCLADGVDTGLRKFFRYRLAGRFLSGNVFEVAKIDRAAFVKPDYDILAKYGIGLGPGEIEALLAAAGCPNLDVFVGLFRTPEGVEKAEAALNEVIGGDRAQALARAFYQLCHNIELEQLRNLLGDNFDEADLLKIYDFLKYRAARKKLTVADLLRADPYHLVHVPDLSRGREYAYSVASRLAESFGMVHDLTKQVAANAAIYLWRAAEQGHTYCETSKVTGFLMGRMNHAFADYRQADACLRETLPQPGRTNTWPSSSFAWEYKLLDVHCTYLSGVYHSEREAAEGLVLILGNPPAVEVDPRELLMAVREAAGFTLNREQEQFVRAVAENKLVLLDGEAGTGKTAVLAALVRGYRKLTGEDVVVLAPTGIAARRLGDAAGVDLNFTIHRFAEIDRAAKDLAVKELVVPVEHETASGKKQQVEKWGVSLVVVDEMSMADIVAFARLIKRCLPGCRLVLAGDSGQLPPVGPGPVFRELLQFVAEGVPWAARVTLRRVYRQKEAGVLDLARSVRRGEFKVPPAGVELIEVLPEEVHARAVEVAVRLWREHGLGRVLVLTSKNLGDRRKKAETASRLLNEDLKRELNSSPCLLGTEFSAGDPIMCVVNDYAPSNGLGAVSGKAGAAGFGLRAPRPTIFNGMQGTVVGIYEGDDVDRPCLEVDFGGTRALYYPEEVGRYLTLAYASTVHKAQGAGADWVVLAVDSPGGWGRDFLYTALTRAKKGVVLVGPRGVFEEMTSREPVARRCTLSKRLALLLAGEETYYVPARSAAEAPEVIPYVAAALENE